MKREDFNKLIEKRFEKIKFTLVTKGKEYADNDDVLRNFRRGAIKSNKTKEEVIEGFLLKHLVSLDDIILDCKKGTLPKEEYLDEKIGDIINYFILLEASIKEEINKKTPF